MVRRGDPVSVVPAVAAEAGATVVIATADFGPHGAGRDAAVAQALSDDGRRLMTVDSNYAVAPGRVRTAAGTPFKVFTAYKRAWEANGWPAPIPHARRPVPPPRRRPGRPLLGARLWPLPGPTACPTGGRASRSVPRRHSPTPGPPRRGTGSSSFVAGPLADYDRDRDLPAVPGTSGLSPYLRFGCLHPRTRVGAPRPRGRGGAPADRAGLA